MKKKKRRLLVDCSLVENNRVFAGEQDLPLGSTVCK